MILKVNKDICEIKQNEVWNVGDYNVHTVEVELSDEFDGLVNKVRYFVEDNSYDMLITDNVAQVPYEATLTEGTIKIGVYGYDADTNILVQSTSPVNKYITSGTYTGEADNTEPLTPTDKQQMESAIQQNTDDIINLQNNKQDVLISGENIKTINNESILGSGNIEIGGGGGGGDSVHEVYIGDTEPSETSVVLWVDTSGAPTPGTTDPVTNLLGSPTSSSVILSWTASSNASSYKIYLGDAFVDSTASVTYTVTGLAPETEYTLGVVATGDGGDSTKVTVTVTTQAGGGGDLPSEYQQVAYVVAPANKGKNGLYSGLKNNEIAKVQIGFEADWSQYQMLWYSGNADNTNRGKPYVYNTLQKTNVVGDGYTINITASPSEYVGETVNVDFTINLSSSNEKYVFFGGAEPDAWAGSDRKIYYIRVFDSSNVLLRNYVPCYRKSDNKVGMYDLVQTEFVIPEETWNKGGNV